MSGSETGSEAAGSETPHRPGNALVDLKIVVLVVCDFLGRLESSLSSEGGNGRPKTPR